MKSNAHHKRMHAQLPFQTSSMTSRPDSVLRDAGIHHTISASGTAITSTPEHSHEVALTNFGF